MDQKRAGVGVLARQGSKLSKELLAAGNAITPSSSDVSSNPMLSKKSKTHGQIKLSCDKIVITSIGSVKFYSLNLTIQPLSEVTVIVQPSNGLLHVNYATTAKLNFTSENYNIPQNVIVKATNHIINENARVKIEHIIRHTFSSEDPLYRNDSKEKDSSQSRVFDLKVQIICFAGTSLLHAGDTMIELVNAKKEPLKDDRAPEEIVYTHTILDRQHEQELREQAAKEKKILKVKKKRRSQSIYVYEEDEEMIYYQEQVTLATIAMLPTESSGVFPPRLKQISQGVDHYAVVDLDNNIYIWGANGRKQLGDDNTIPAIPHPIQPMLLDTNGRFYDSIDKVACGDGFTVAITSLGGVVVWGINSSGQLGIGSNEEIFAPRQIPSFDALKVVDIAAGQSHVLAVVDQKGFKRVYSWGSGKYGALGYKCESALVPTRIESLTDPPLKVAAGDLHSAVVTTEGKLFTCGWTEKGRLGRRYKATSTGCDFNFHIVEGSIKDALVIDVSCGRSHNIALTTDGMVHAWGSNEDGELGLGDIMNRCTPVKLQFFDREVISISAGDRYSIAVETESGYAYTWGLNDQHQLGLKDGFANNHHLPRLLPSLVDFRSTLVSAGRGTSIFCGFKNVVSKGIGATVANDLRLEAEKSNSPRHGSVVSGGRHGSVHSPPRHGSILVKSPQEKNGADGGGRRLTVMEEKSMQQKLFDELEASRKHKEKVDLIVKKEQDRVKRVLQTIEASRLGMRVHRSLKIAATQPTTIKAVSSSKYVQETTALFHNKRFEMHLKHTAGYERKATMEELNKIETEIQVAEEKENDEIIDELEDRKVALQRSMHRLDDQVHTFKTIPMDEKDLRAKLLVSRAQHLLYILENKDTVVDTGALNSGKAGGAMDFVPTPQFRYRAISQEQNDHKKTTRSNSVSSVGGGGGADGAEDPLLSGIKYSSPLINRGTRRGSSSSISSVELMAGRGAMYVSHAPDEREGDGERGEIQNGGRQHATIKATDKEGAFEGFNVRPPKGGPSFKSKHMRQFGRR